MSLRVIGDVHGLFEKYAKITDGCDWSVQLGDFGFRYSGDNLCNRVHPYRHRFFGGNHDNYDIYDLTPRSLGNYGVECIGDVEFFYIRGAFSIDWMDRQYDMPPTWWNQEQLDVKQMQVAYDLYCRVKPEIMITHTAPRSIANMVGGDYILKQFGYNPERFTTNTQELLEACIVAHQPKTWLFGHFHKNWHTNWCGTDFQCIAECDYVDLPSN